MIVFYPVKRNKKRNHDYCSMADWRFRYILLKKLW